MKNINSVISSHDKFILNLRTASFGCNCLKKEICPINGDRWTPHLVCRATSTNAANEDIRNIDLVISSLKKDIVTNYKRESKHQNKYCNWVELAKYVWELTLEAPIPQNGQTHWNNSSAIVRVCLTILWNWRVKN